MTSAENRWQSVLDELRSDLDRVEAGLEQGAVAIDLGPFRPPSNLPPLPSSMVAAARDLSRRHDELLRVVTAHQKTLVTKRRHQTPTRRPARFEARA